MSLLLYKEEPLQSFLLILQVSSLEAHHLNLLSPVIIDNTTVSAPAQHVMCRNLDSLNHVTVLCQLHRPYIELMMELNDGLGRRGSTAFLIVLFLHLTVRIKIKTITVSVSFSYHISKVRFKPGTPKHKGGIQSITLLTLIKILASVVSITLK